MKAIPLATAADSSQIERIRPIVEGRACVVVGSAPLSAKYADVQPYETTVAVNGGISSLPHIANIWVLNSKQQDQPGASIRPLHTAMLRQGANRSVRHIVFLRGPKVASEQGTLATLKNLHCSHSTWSVLDKPTKRWIEGECCGRVDDKRPCSSGLLTLACLLWAGAASVRIVGFSLKPGYHYLPTERPQSWWRDHIEADRRGLASLRVRYGPKVVGDFDRQEVAA